MIYLFNAFIERLLNEGLFRAQRTRRGARGTRGPSATPRRFGPYGPQINAMPGQKIISSHSPYFIQYVPIRDIRLLRRGPDGVQAHYRFLMPFSVVLPPKDALDSL